MLVKCPESPLCRYDPSGDPLVIAVCGDVVLVECLKCMVPMIVARSCQEPTHEQWEQWRRWTERTLGYPIRLRGHRNKYAHPHEHVYPAMDPAMAKMATGLAKVKGCAVC